MIKQTLMFTTPVSLSLKDQQLVITFKDNKDTVTRPIEDIGFVMLQYSVYIRHCASKESQAVHIKRVKSIVPNTGMVSILSVTDKQYGDIVNFWGKEKEKKYRQTHYNWNFFSIFAA